MWKLILWPIYSEFVCKNALITVVFGKYCWDLSHGRESTLGVYISTTPWWSETHPNEIVTPSLECYLENGRNHDGWNQIPLCLKIQHYLKASKEQKKVSGHWDRYQCANYIQTTSKLAKNKSKTSWIMEPNSESMYVARTKGSRPAVLWAG